jgi:hypothetical protein
MEPTLERIFPRRAAAAHELCSAERSVHRCGVCGFREVRTDEVFDSGVVLLAECGRCRHRWTAKAPRVAVPTLRHRRAVEEAA